MNDIYHILHLIIILTQLIILRAVLDNRRHK